MRGRRMKKWVSRYGAEWNAGNREEREVGDGGRKENLRWNVVVG